MTDPLTLLLWATVVGATSAGVTVALRALKPIQKRIESAQKPWACDVCMSFWTTAAATAALVAYSGDNVLLLTAGPAYPWAQWVLRKITDPHGPPSLPPLEDSDA